MMTGAERARRYRERHPERVKAALRRAHAERSRDPAYRAAERARVAAYRQANLEQVRERERERQRARWGEPGLHEKHRGLQAARRARVRSSMVERVDVEAVLIRDAGICGICGEAVGPDWHLDHIVALANGGAHSYANVQVAHALCNVRKGAR